MMPAVDFEGIEAAALRSARSAIGASNWGAKDRQEQTNAGCYAMSSGLTTIGPQLGRLLPLLGSNHDSEVVATERAIGRVLQGAGCDWHDLVKALLPTPAPIDAADLPSEKSAILWCFHRRHELTLRDHQLIENLTDRHKPLSPKQQKWPRDIREKLERGAAA
jgi:hypothetical protein